MFPFTAHLYVQVPFWVGLAYWIYQVYQKRTIAASHRREAEKRGCEPPKERPGNWFWGLDLIYKQYHFLKSHTILEHGHKDFERFGVRTFKVRVLGDDFFTTIEPANVQSALATDFTSWSLGASRDVMKPLLGPGIFSTDGAAWRHSRDLLRPNFNRSQIGDVELFKRHAGHLLRIIPRDGSTIDLQPLFFRLSMDISTDLLFGQSTNDLAGKASTPETLKFVEAWDRATEKLGGGRGLGPLDAFLPDPQHTKDCKTVHDFANGIIAKAVAKRSKEKALALESENRYVFLDQLLDQTSDIVKIRTELLNILLAGRDTTASLLSNLCFTISHRPDIQSRLRDEIDGLEDLGFETVKDLRYLRAFINESLRMYPIVPMNARQAAADTTLPLGGGPDQQSPIFVPKGCYMGWNLYSIHRRKDIYGEDAEEFKPERWLDEGEKKGIRPGWGFLPFNGGPRICIGQQFALAETSYILIRLLQEFSFESRDPEPWRENLKLTCSVFGGCKVALTPRL